MVKRGVKPQSPTGWRWSRHAVFLSPLLPYSSNTSRRDQRCGGDGQPYVINLVDTPGHSDFSEDTYRVLTAVDGALMLIDAAKGLEPQTLKLFRVCKSRNIPIITVVNKWDRPGKSPLNCLTR